MPNQSPAQLANLRPFSKGHRVNGRADSAKHKALRISKLSSPEAVEFNLAVMRDPAESIMARLRASENILKCAFPTKSAHVDAGDLAPAERYLQVIFVKPGEQPQTSNGHLIDGPANSFAVSFDGD